MKKPLLISMLLLVFALLMTSAAAETITYTGPEAMTVGATFTVKHDCGNPNAVCTVTKAATCKTDGVGSCFCDECGEAYANWTVTIASNANFHTNIHREVGKAATCTTDGHYDERCRDCAKLVNLEVETIPAKGHDWIDDSEDDLHVYKQPTCGDEGAGYYNCRRCADVKKVTIPAQGNHYLEYPIARNYKATCHYEGSVYACCMVCSYEYSETTPIDPNNHTYLVTVELTPCVGLSSKTYECLDCGYEAIVPDYTPVEGPGHVWVTISRTEATCSTTGVEKQQCSRCLSEQTLTLEKDPTNHTDIQREIGKAATCTTDGHYDERCHACTKLVNLEVESIPAKGHDWIDDSEDDLHITREATCTEGAGYYNCRRCATVKKVVIPANHTWGQFELVKEATCTTKGQKMRTCTLCGEIEYSDINIRKNNHVWSAWETVQEATCQVGKQEERTCTLCGQTEFIEWETRLEHNWIDIVLLQDATCTKDGLQRGTCSFCGLTSEIPLPATGHPSSTLVKIKDPTCTESGYSSYLCDVCGESTSDSDLGLLPLGHDWTEWVSVEATCASPKYTERTCERCGISERTEEGEPLDHIWAVADIIQDATCTAPGVALMSCTLCGHESEMPIPQRDHILTVVPSVPATATTRGSTYGIVCELCGYWEKEPHPIDMMDVFADVTVVLKGDDIGTIYDKDGNVIGQDPELCALILDLVAKSGGDESVDYVTVYRGVDGVMYAYVDSNGDMYAGFDDNYILLFNIDELHPDTAE